MFDSSFNPFFNPRLIQVQVTSLDAFLLCRKMKRQRKHILWKQVINIWNSKGKISLTDLATSSRLVVSRTTNGAGVIKSPTTWPFVLLSNFCTSLKVCKIEDRFSSKGENYIINKNMISSVANCSELKQIQVMQPLKLTIQFVKNQYCQNRKGLVCSTTLLCITKRIKSI